MTQQSFVRRSVSNSVRRQAREASVRAAGRVVIRSLVALVVALFVAAAANSMSASFGGRVGTSAEISAGASKAAADEPRGYSIPLIDLAGETQRQVVVDREEKQYLGHPTTLLLEDGRTMLIVYPKGHGKGAIQYQRSPDGGKTWSGRLPTPENWTTSQETPTIHRTVDASGKKRIILFSGLYPIRMAYTEDDGATWSPLKPIGTFGGIVAMGSVERLKDGAYMALFHDDGRFIQQGGTKTKGLFHVYMTLSRDGGLTWSEPIVIAHDPAVHLCEPGLVRSPDGKQMAVLLRENSRKRNSFVIFSDDEGATWSKPRELPGALTGDRHVA
ncbi:MAG TPA: sialidase family protein, partial [Pirellulaceae bacterium]|nr:sialidase family protein [Pirellulaceae bacterium]